jgi:alpha,alpha-trehalase
LWETGEFTGAVTAANAVSPFSADRDADQARVLAAAVDQKLLDVGGLVTTLVESGQQWMRPMGGRRAMDRGIGCAQLRGRPAQE